MEKIVYAKEEHWWYQIGVKFLEQIYAKIGEL